MNLFKGAWRPFLWIAPWPLAFRLGPWYLGKRSWLQVTGTRTLRQSLEQLLFCTEHQGAANKNRLVDRLHIL